MEVSLLLFSCLLIGATAGAPVASLSEQAVHVAPAKTAKTPTTKAAKAEAVAPDDRLHTSAELANLARRLNGHRASKDDLRWLEAKAKKGPNSVRIAAAILRAEQAYAHANPKDGDARFAALIEEHDELGDYLNLRLGDQALRVKAYDTAIKAFTVVDDRKYRGSRQRQARLGLLRARYRKAADDEAWQALKRFRSLCRSCMDGGTDDVLYIEAHLQLLHGNKSKAKTQLTELVDRFPDRAGGAQADLLLQEHFSGAPMTLDRKLRSISFQAGRRGDRWAVDELRKLAARYDKRPALLLEVQIALGRQLRRVDPVEGVGLLDQLQRQIDPKHPRWEALQAARRMVLPRVGRYAETADDYFRQAWQTESSSYRAERLFYAGWSLFGDGDYRNAAEIFAWLQPAKGLSSELRERTRWYAPWSLYRAGDYAAALEAFDELALRHAAWAPRATYWAGRSALAMGDDEKGMLRFQVLRDRWPHTLYGLRVAGLPTSSAQSPYALSDQRRRALAKGSDSTRLRIAVMANLGDHNASRGVALRGRTPVEPAIAIQWGQALGDVGVHHAGFLVATRALRYVPGIPGQNHRELWELAYPRPWFSRCEGCAEVDDIPTAMVYAIMREESQFRPAVESPAEAVGLMQIIPPTAALIAARLDGRKVDHEALDDPNSNIALGTWYLANLARRYDQQLPLVMAAYNAGPSAADGWIRRANRLKMDLTEFMEEVPYSETRGYVKRVSRSLAVYRMLYGMEAGTFSPMVQGLVQNRISGDITF